MEWLNLATLDTLNRTAFLIYLYTQQTIFVEECLRYKSTREIETFLLRNFEILTFKINYLFYTQIYQNLTFLK